MTRGRTCTDPEIQALVESDSMEVTLAKQNDHLVGDFKPTHATVRVGPSAEYPLDTLSWKLDLGNYSGYCNWLRVGLRNSAGEHSSKVPLYVLWIGGAWATLHGFVDGRHFNASNMSDSTEVRATLIFIGNSGHVKAKPGVIQITGVLVCVQ